MRRAFKNPSISSVCVASVTGRMLVTSMAAILCHIMYVTFISDRTASVYQVS
jgi:hypothetical protein